MYNFNQSLFLNQQTLTEQQKSYLTTLFSNYSNILSQQQALNNSNNYNQPQQNPFSYWLEKKKALDSVVKKNSIYRKGI